MLRTCPSFTARIWGAHSICGPLHSGQSQSAARRVVFVKSMGTEVEVKLRLDSKGAHDKIVSTLASGQRHLWEQENYFFDGSKGELLSQHCVMRVRIYNGHEKALLTVKGKMSIVDGIGRASEEEVSIDPQQARRFVSNPALLLQDGIELVDKVIKRIGASSLKCLGGFKNIRKEIDWQGNLLEVDETQYDWGTLYEIECETSEPEKVREDLEALLLSYGIAYTYKTATKFQNFINRTLL